MLIPPEVVFHLFFQTLSPSDRERYLGKHDLSGLDPGFDALLLAIQDAWVEGLKNERPVPEHVDHPPFHLDYVDSNIPNALAFRYEGYSFIGITISLIFALWDRSVQLSTSESVASLLNLKLEELESGALRVVFFRIMLMFVVTHEYTHHVHGHVIPAEAGSLFSNEIMDGAQVGSLGQQAVEADADGYAVYHLFNNLVDGSARPSIVNLLKLDSLSLKQQEESIFDCVVIAVGTFLLLRPAPTLDKNTIYRLTHPPHAARMHLIMIWAIRWCKKMRPDLEGWMQPARFLALMAGVAQTFWGSDGVVQKEWGAQSTFLQSEDGLEYMKALDASISAHISSL